MFGNMPTSRSSILNLASGPHQPQVLAGLSAQPPVISTELSPHYVDGMWGIQDLTTILGGYSILFLLQRRYRHILPQYLESAKTIPTTSGNVSSLRLWTFKVISNLECQALRSPSPHGPGPNEL